MRKDWKKCAVLAGVLLLSMVPLAGLQALEDDPLHTVFSRYHTYERGLGAFQSVNELINRLGLACFYLDPTGVVNEHHTLRFDRTGITPAEVLDAIVAADSRLTWVAVDNRLVNVLPIALVEDRASVLYLPISNFLVEDVPLREAIAAVTALVPQEHQYAGFTGGSMGGLPGGGTIYDRNVTVRLASGTYLDLVNALMKAAGDDVGILANGPTGLTPVKSFQGRTDTAALANSERYLEGSAPLDRDEAVRRFQRALQDAPYPAVRKVIRFRLGELYMGSAGRLAYKLGDAPPDKERALPIFRELAVPRESSDADANVYNRCRDYAVAMLLEQGQTAEARQLLESIINHPFSAGLVDVESMYASLIGLEIQGLGREDAVTRLVSMGIEQPGNAPFHRALESRLERERAAIQ